VDNGIKVSEKHEVIHLEMRLLVTNAETRDGREYIGWTFPAREVDTPGGLKLPHLTRAVPA